MFSFANISISTMFSSGVYGIPTPPPKSIKSKSTPASSWTFPAISIVDSIANLNGSGSKIPEPMWECIPTGVKPKSSANWYTSAASLSIIPNLLITPPVIQWSWWPAPTIGFTLNDILNPSGSTTSANLFNAETESRLRTAPCSATNFNSSVVTLLPVNNILSPENPNFLEVYTSPGDTASIQHPSLSRIFITAKLVLALHA